MGLSMKKSCALKNRPIKRPFYVTLTFYMQISSINLNGHSFCCTFRNLVVERSSNC